MPAARGRAGADAEGRWLPTTFDLGRHGEWIASAYLSDAGLQLLDRTWRCREGALDLVARDGNAIVFGETGGVTPAR